MVNKLVIAIAILNFFIPFVLILRNSALSKEEKIKRLVKAILVMGLISGATILFVLSKGS